MHASIEVNWRGNGTESELACAAEKVHGRAKVDLSISYQAASEFSNAVRSLRVEDEEVNVDECEVVAEVAALSVACRMFGSGRMSSHH